MKATVEKFPECQATLRVELPAEAVTAERNQIVVAFSKQAKVPGFRPGKVPKGVIEKRYAKDIEEELIGRLVRTGCSDAIKAENLKVLHVEDVENPELHVDGTFSFVAKLSTQPEITLPDYKEIAVELPEVIVTEENIANSIDRVREKVATFEDVEGRGTTSGDFVIVDYSGNIDGSPISEAVEKAAGYLAEGTDAWIEVTEEGFLPGFAMQLVGAGKGEERKVIVRFPKDFNVFELQGVEANYNVTVKEIKKRNLPEVNDAWCETMFDGKNLEQSREWITENLREQMEQRVDELKTSQILEFLHTSTDFELPKSALARQAQLLVDQVVERGQSQGIADEEIMEHQDEILANANEQAKLDVKSRFLLLEIANKEELEVSQRELAMQVSGLAQQNKVAPKKMAKQLKDSGNLETLAEQILASKTLDFLKSSASVTIKVKDAAPEQLSGTESPESETKNEE
ncbi:MAG: trigger factor [Verrucomicrobiales bacterium]|jgi:trigger factor